MILEPQRSVCYTSGQPSHSSSGSEGFTFAPGAVLIQVVYRSLVPQTVHTLHHKRVLCGTLAEHWMYVNQTLIYKRSLLFDLGNGIDKMMVCARERTCCGSSHTKHFLKTRLSDATNVLTSV